MPITVANSNWHQKKGTSKKNIITKFKNAKGNYGWVFSPLDSVIIVAVDAWLGGRGELCPCSVSHIAEREGRDEHDIFMSPIEGDDVVPLLDTDVTDTADEGLAFCIAFSFMKLFISCICWCVKALGSWSGIAPTVSANGDCVECENVADVDAVGGRTGEGERRGAAGLNGGMFSCCLSR